MWPTKGNRTNKLYITSIRNSFIVFNFLFLYIFINFDDINVRRIIQNKTLLKNSFPLLSEANKMLNYLYVIIDSYTFNP